MEWIIGIIILIFAIKYFRKDRYFTVVDIKDYDRVSAELMRMGQYEAIHFTDINKLKKYCKKYNINVMILKNRERWNENNAVIATNDMPNEVYEEENY